jgi:hypothetical protein
MHVINMVVQVSKINYQWIIEKALCFHTTLQFVCTGNGLRSRQQENRPQYRPEHRVPKDTMTPQA